MALAKCRAWRGSRRSCSRRSRLAAALRGRRRSGSWCSVATLLAGRVARRGAASRGARPTTASAERAASPRAASRRTSRKDERPRIARKGQPLEAAELCFAVGLLDEAAEYFIEAGEFVRAAEIRHDQNRFLEAAELYSKAGNHDTAGAIYAQQEEFGRAAECESSRRAT